MKRHRTFDHEIQLIGLVEGVDDDGFPTKELRPQPPILANKLSVRSSEYWQAKQSGVELSIVFEVHSFEYNGEEVLRYGENDDEYTIERTYENSDGFMELTCKRKSDDHAS